MALLLETRRTGDADVHVIACAGRIVDGDEAVRLREQIDQSLRLTRHIVLDLSGVDFVDSFGLGVLARTLGRVRLDGGDLKLCSVPDRIQQVLTATRLRPLFDIHASADDAVRACGAAAPRAAEHRQVATDVLCVHPSRDVLVFLSALLEGAGFLAATATNVADALVLLQGAKPKAVILDGALRDAIHSGSASRFFHLVETLPVVELPSTFATNDPAAAGQALLADVRAAVG